MRDPFVIAAYRNGGRSRCTGAGTHPGTLFKYRQGAGPDDSQHAGIVHSGHEPAAVQAIM